MTLMHHTSVWLIGVGMPNPAPCQHNDAGHQNDDQSFTLWHFGSFCVVGHSVYNEFVLKAEWAVIFRSDRATWGR